MVMTKTRVLVILGFLLIFLTGWNIYAQNTEMKREIYLKNQSAQKQLVEPTPLPSPTPDIIEIDTRDPEDLKKIDDFFSEYCKTNDCATPKPSIQATPIPIAREKITIADPNEKGLCYVEKNGSFEMTTKECMELSNADQMGFRIKAYTNCLDGKNPEVGDSGSPESRKQKCSDLMGIVEKDQ